jgi:hypothetical protein
MGHHHTINLSDLFSTNSDVDTGAVEGEEKSSATFRKWWKVAPYGPVARILDQPGFKVVSSNF